MCGIRLKYHSSNRLTDRIIEGLSDKCHILLRWYNKKRFVSLDILKNALQSGLVSETATSKTLLNDFREKNACLRKDFKLTAFELVG